MKHTASFEAFSKFPKEIKEYSQWCLVSDSGLPALPKDGRLLPVDVDSDKLLSFHDAVSSSRYMHPIGFVLKKEDPYTVIDIDVRHDSTTTRTDLAVDTFNAINSYSELSPTGLGIRIWVKGNLGCSKQVDGVEISSKGKFIVCTGCSFNMIIYAVKNHFDKTVSIKSIDRRGLEVKHIYSALPYLESIGFNFDENEKQANYPAGEGEEQSIEVMTPEDLTFVKKVFSETKGKEAKRLCRGEWRQLGFENKSEADYALLSIFAIYSRDNNRCKRVFKQTVLGRDSKATARYIWRLLARIRAGWKTVNTIHLKNSK